MGRFENIEHVMCEELERMNEKYQNGQEISSGDLQKADMIFHALKSAETYKAMKGEYGMDEGRSERSYARGRNPETGRYVSRDGGSYRGNSMRYPQEMIDPYWDRR